MSNLSDLLPSGAGGKSFNFVASGTLANGQTVGLRSDGKVEAITGVTQAIGTPAVFETGGTQYVASAYDVNAQRVVVAYRDQGNSNYGTAVAIATAGTPEDLTIGQQYFVQTDGSLGTSADSPSVIAGTAIGASELIVKG